MNELNLGAKGAVTPGSKAMGVNDPHSGHSLDALSLFWTIRVCNLKLVW